MSARNDRPDVFLNAIIGMTGPGVSIGLTLTIKGIVVTGTLVSQERYFEQVKQDLREGFERAFQEGAEGLLASIGKFGEIPNEVINDDETSECLYVHLLNARFVTGNQVVPSNLGIAWRGKISQVDGFSFGELKINS